MMQGARAGWSIAVHGGVGSMTPHTLSQLDEAGCRTGLVTALDAGGKVLAAGGGAVDAVCAAACVLEDYPLFNAGRGAVFTRDGQIELDAAVMDGRGQHAGAVAGVSTVRNPVLLARAVMERSPHVFLARDGAEQFAREQGFAPTDAAWFATAERRRQLDEMLAAEGDGFDAAMKYGTIGVVARDGAGHLATATSTGGLTGKRWARIGDTPVIGAGTWAEDGICAVSATGTGEVFIRLAAAHEIAARIRLSGQSAQEAADGVIARVGQMGGKGGVIVVDRAGQVALAFNTTGMFRGWRNAEGAGGVAVFREGLERQP